MRLKLSDEIWKKLLFEIIYLEWAVWNLPKWKSLTQNKKIRFGNKMCYLDMFWPVILKLLPYLKSALSNLANRKVSFKMKKKKNWNKIWKQKLSFLGVFKFQFWKSIVTFETGSPFINELLIKVLFKKNVQSPPFI